MALKREVLPDRTEARQECLRASRQAETTHTLLTFTRGLMAGFCAIADAGGGLVAPHLYDDRRGEAMAVVKRFRLFHHDMLRDQLSNVTTPWLVHRLFLFPEDVGEAWRSHERDSIASRVIENRR